MLLASLALLIGLPQWRIPMRVDAELDGPLAGQVVQQFGRVAVNRVGGWACTTALMSGRSW